jgi:type IV pilus assembly protein PilP
MITIKQNINIFFIGIVSILLVSCSGDNSDLVKYINDTKARKPKAIEPIPKFSPLPFFKFPDATGRRNPFKPIDHKKRNEDFSPDQNRKKEPLEAYPLDSLKFVGTLNEGYKIWGLIKLPDGQVSRVKVGEYMGQNYGRVLNINVNFIKLEETTKNSGAWEKHVTTINLYVGK